MSSSSHVPRKQPVFVAWTTLNIPALSTFEDWRTEDGRTWLSIIRPMTSSKQAGFIRGSWGRIRGSERGVWFITCWQSTDALEKFEASSTWSTQRELLASMSMAPPDTVHVEFGGGWWDRETGEMVVADVSFPANITSEVRAKIEDALTMFYTSHLEDLGGNSNGAACVHGWFSEPAKYQGEEMITLRTVNQRTERKEGFKTKATVPEEGSEVLEYDRFLKELEELGMVRRKEEYCTFSHIPTSFR